MDNGINFTINLSLWYTLYIGNFYNSEKRKSNEFYDPERYASTN